MPKERDYQKSTTRTRQLHITWRHHQLTDGTRPRSNKSKKIVADKEFEPELKPTKHAHYHYTMHLVVEEFGNGMYLNLQI